MVLKNYHKSGSVNMKWAKSSAIQSWIAMKLVLISRMRISQKFPIQLPHVLTAKISLLIQFWNLNFDFIELMSLGKSIVALWLFTLSLRSDFKHKSNENVSRNVMAVVMILLLEASIYCFLISWIIQWMTEVLQFICGGKSGRSFTN